MARRQKAIHLKANFGLTPAELRAAAKKLDY
jgi:hypothetical protein